MFEICLNLTIKPPEDVIDVALEFLFNKFFIEL